MNLSSDLVSQFVKSTNDSKKTTDNNIVYGTVIKSEDGKKTYVKLDGSDVITPLSTSTAAVKSGDTVAVMIKNHKAIAIGSTSNQSTGIAEFEITEGKIDSIIIDTAKIDSVIADNVEIKERLTATEANVEDLVAEDVIIKSNLDANNAQIESLQTTKLDADVADLTYAKITKLEVIEQQVYDLEATHGEFKTVATNRFEAIDATIAELDTGSISAEEADLKYANIDFSNISKATMEWFYSNSGLIENVLVGDGTITGTLVGVTITGDLIEGNTIKADKLVIKGDDGLYYKLNTDGVTLEEEQTDENSLNGTVIQAKSITASKISVSDLVAFDATIGGFHITDNAIYSEVKDSEDNVTRGIYMDSDGQINFGDSSNFIKYYADEDGTYKLAISAASILYALNGKQYSIADLGQIGDYVHISTYEGEPCIELGESDSDFKLIITNTRILFMEGSDLPAYINNQSLHIKKAVIEEELQQGGFVWKARSNGNMGLVWKGEV